MNKNYRKGYTLERAIVNTYRKRGCYATRAAGSHSAYDVIAIDGNKLMLIQCKSGKLSPGQLQEALNKMPNVPLTLEVVEAVVHKDKTGTVWTLKD